MIARTKVADGTICPECEKRLRPAFPKYEKYPKPGSVKIGYDCSGITDYATPSEVDPMASLTIEELRRHLEPSRYMVEERETAPVKDKQAYEVVLANIRRGQAAPVTKAVVSTCDIPLERAWEFPDKLPVTLGTNIPCGEAQRWKRVIEAEGAIVELR